MQSKAPGGRLAPRVVVISYRLGGADGVSAEAGKWVWALQSLGCVVSTVAGEGIADHLLPGLAAGPYLTGAPAPPLLPQEIEAIVAPADLVVVENLCSLPLNPAAGEAVARALRGRPALLRHHDLPWQRQAFASMPPPPDDPSWCHVAITGQARSELGRHGIRAVTLHNRFDPQPPRGDREATRRALGVAERDLLLVQPTRAIRRKGVDRAIALASALGATYWLVGPAEEGYGEELDALFACAGSRCIHGPLPGLVTPTRGIEHAYAAADLVVFPSRQEGFGNPPVEASLHLRPVAVGPYASGGELRAMGFRWLDAYRLDQVRAWLSEPRPAVLAANAAAARRHLNLGDLPGRLAGILSGFGLAPKAMPSQAEVVTPARPLPSRRS